MEIFSLIFQIQILRLVQPPACGDPTGLNTTSITQTSATVSWSAVSGAINYDVDYKAASSGTWINAATDNFTYRLINWSYLPLQYMIGE